MQSVLTVAAVTGVRAVEAVLGPGSLEGPGELRLAATRVIPITPAMMRTTSRVDRERRVGWGPFDGSAASCMAG